MDCGSQLSSLAETIIIVVCPITSTFYGSAQLFLCAKMKCWCMAGLVRKREWLGVRPFLWYSSDDFQGSTLGADRRLSWTPRGSLVGQPDHRKVWSLKHFFFADFQGLSLECVFPANAQLSFVSVFVDGVLGLLWFVDEPRCNWVKRFRPWPCNLRNCRIAY